MWLAVCTDESEYLSWLTAEERLLGAIASVLESRDQVLVRRGTANELHRTLRAEWVGGAEGNTRLQILDKQVNVCVYCLSGLPADTVDKVRGAASKVPGVLGSTVLSPADRRLLHYFNLVLPLSFRVVGDSLRVLHHSAYLDGDLTFREGQVEHLRGTGQFSAVLLEDTGLEATILDDINSKEAFDRQIRLCELAPDPWLAESVCVWLTSVDPNLKAVLFAAVERAATARTPEQASQAALSVRRYLERLADALFEPRSEPHHDMKVTADKWKNRLAAAVHDRAGRAESTAKPTTEAARLHKLLMEIANAADAGVHRRSGLSLDEAGALVGQVLSFSNQVRAQCPPGLVAPLEPYIEFVEQWLALVLATEDQDPTQS